MAEIIFTPFGVSGGGVLAGDVTGPIAANTVVAIQGTPVSAAAPAPGDVLTLVAGVWTPAPGAGGGTLQSAYVGGNTIAVSAAEGIITFSDTDVTDVLNINRTFAGVGEALAISMGAATTGNALDITMVAGSTGNAIAVTNGVDSRRLNVTSLTGTVGFSIIAGDSASEELVLRGTSAANLGLVRMQSPITFNDVTPAIALQPFSIADTSTQAIAVAFVGGTFNASPTISFTNLSFSYAGVRVAPDITSGTSSAFATFTMLQGLPNLRAGAAVGQNPLTPLVINAGPSMNNAFAAARTVTTPTGVSWTPTLRTTLAGGTLTATGITGLINRPTWSTVAGTTVAFGTIRAVHAQSPAVVIGGTDLGTETMTAYIGLDMDAMAFGGDVTKVAVRSALAAASAAFFLLGTGTAQSEFAGEVRLNNAVNLTLGTDGGNRVQLQRSAAGTLLMAGVGGANNENLIWNFDSAPNIVLVTSGTGAGIHFGTTTLGFFTATPVTQRGPYTPTNVVADRSYDAAATTVNELANVVGAMIADLQSLGLFG
jgi:hypothetical protein